MKKKSFTLIEILIVICILGMFMGVLFKTYTTISEISFKVEQEKRVNEEYLFVSEILQNFANRNTIDYTRYNNDLKNSSGFTDILYMSGEDGVFSIYSSGNCIPLGEVPNLDVLNSGCFLLLDKGDGIEVKLTDDGVYFGQVKFRIIPYADSDTYFSDNGSSLCDTNYFACINDLGFWMFVDVYTKFYTDDNRANDVKLNSQQFFNI